MNIIIIGTGMYVTGRGTGGYGTILPAITEWKRSGRPLSKVLLVGDQQETLIGSLAKSKNFADHYRSSI